MVKKDFEIVFNNGTLRRQILILPEAPLKIFFFFEGKELHLRKKKGNEYLYAISYQRGFPETHSKKEPKQNAPKRSLDNASLSNNYKQSSEISTNRPKLCTQVLRCPDSTKNLNDKQVIGNDDAIYPISLPESRSSPQRKKNNISQKTLIRKAICEKPKEEIIENEVGDEQINAVTDRTSVIKKNVQVAHKSRVIIQENQQDIIKPVSSSNAGNKDQIEEINSSDEDDNMAIDMGATFSDDSTDKEDSANTPQKKKMCLTWKNADVPVGVLIQQNKSEKQSRSSKGLENDNQINPAVTRNPTITYLKLDFSAESVDDPDSTSHPQKESFVAPVNRTDCNQVCDDQDQEDQLNESTGLQKKGRCNFCLKFVFRNDNRRRLYKFPKCSEISKMWANASGMKCIIEATAPERRKRFDVCSDHFTIKDYANPAKRSRLKWSAVPTQHLPKSKIINPLLPQNTNILESMKSKLKLALKKPDLKLSSYPSPSTAESKITLQTSFKMSPESKCKTAPKVDVQESLLNILSDGSSGSVIKTITFQSLSGSSVNKESGNVLSNSVLLPLASSSTTAVQKITLEDLLKATSSKLKTECKMSTETSSQSSLNESHNESHSSEVLETITDTPSSVVQSEKLVTEVTSQEALLTNE